MTPTRAVALAFFLSGAAGLVFEVVWFHRFGLVFGQSVGAASIVLSSYMGGLALGTALVVCRRWRFGHLLRVYAALEFTVAIAGLGLTYALPHLPRLTGGLPRLVTAFAALLIPTTAMGATLPVLVGSRSTGPRTFGETLGRLYGWNTLGAVWGALASEIVLVDRIGVSGSAWAAALLNVCAGIIALVVAERIPVPAAVSSGSGRDASSRRLILIAAALAGSALLALEVVWFRFLSMYVLTTTLTMSLMLAVVLAGIGLGGLAASRWSIRGDIRCATVALMTGGATLLSYAAFQSLTHGTQIAEWYRVAWLACALTAPTAFLSGVLFTAFGAALRDAGLPMSERGDLRAAAWLTLANTAGAMCGAPLAAFALLPALGIERTLWALGASYAGIGLLAMRAGAPASAPWRSPAFVLSGVVLVLALGGFPFGLMASTYFPRSAQAYAGDGSTIVATREGPSETIFLMQQRWLGQPVYSRLVTNGFSMTGTASPALRYMRYFAYWPMLLHDAPLRRALIICYGAGVTAGAALDLPALETLDIVEISRDMVSMSDIIYATGRHPLRDPRARLHLEDGRVFLQTSLERFDLITGEPPPPRTPGAANIYTREYFQLIYDRLAEGGLTTYWLPVARPDPGSDVNTIVRAFCDVFADCSLWNATPFDFMLVGARHAHGPVSAASFAAAWSTPVLSARLREIGLEEPEQIGATFLGDASFLRQLIGDVPPLTDNFPQRLRPSRGRASLSDPRYPEYPAAVEMYRRVLDPVRARAAFASSAFISRLWPAALATGTLARFEEQRMINRVLWEGGHPLAQIEDLDALLRGSSLRTLPLWFLGSDEVKDRIAAASTERSSATDYASALRALAGRDYRRAAAYFGEAERRGLQGDTIRPLAVYSLCLAGDLETARLLARGLEAHSDGEKHFWGWMRTTFNVER